MFVYNDCRYGRQQTYRRDWGKGHHRTSVNQGTSSGDKAGMRYGDRMSSSGMSGYDYGHRRQFKDDKDSEQEYRTASRFTRQQSNVPGNLERSYEADTSSPTSEPEKNQKTAPKEDSPKENLEIQTKTEPERERTEIFHMQKKESGDYFNPGYIHKSEIQEMVNLCSNCKHNLLGDWKSDSEGLHRDSFHADSRTDSEAAANRLLMTRKCGNDKARTYYGGWSRQTTYRLSQFNTLKPPTSVSHRVTATYNDLVSPCNDPPPMDDTEPGLLQFFSECL